MKRKFKGLTNGARRCLVQLAVVERTGSIVKYRDPQFQRYRASLKRGGYEGKSGLSPVGQAVAAELRRLAELHPRVLENVMQQIREALGVPPPYDATTDTAITPTPDT